MNESAMAIGVKNLLSNCAKAQAGQHLLIAYEPPEFGYFDAEAAEVVAAEAQKMGLQVSRRNVGFEPHNPVIDPDLLAQMKQVDIVVFLARLGDQMRFVEMPAGTVIINSFTLNSFMLGSAFATVHHDALLELKTAVDQLFSQAKEITITCPLGTDVRGQPNLQNQAAEDTTLKRFPLSVFAPVPADAFSGRVAMGGFLTGTGSRYYDQSTIEFAGSVFANIQDGRLQGFDGAQADVDKATAQYDRVSNLFDIDRDFIHSWHAGIHPGCGFPWDIRENYDRWSGSAFGNPRILHFHTCGAYAPGEISWNIIDPTISVDGIELWKDGRFLADKLTGGADVLARFPCAAQIFANPDRDIGLLEVA